MQCSMCPTVTLNAKMEPGYGWQCVCREINCVHFHACSACGANRYDLEHAGRVSNGKLVNLTSLA